MVTTDVLHRILASLNVLSMKFRQFHWNIESSLFEPLHEFFGEQYQLLDPTIDSLAEFIRTYNCYSYGTFYDFLKMSIISENMQMGISAREMFTQLSYDINTLATYMQQNADKMTDLVAQNHIIGIIEQLKKTLWMINSQLR